MVRFLLKRRPFTHDPVSDPYLTDYLPDLSCLETVVAKVRPFNAPAPSSSSTLPTRCESDMGIS